MLRAQFFAKPLCFIKRILCLLRFAAQAIELRGRRLWSEVLHG
jgi:hypothetical protein